MKIIGSKSLNLLFDVSPEEASDITSISVGDDGAEIYNYIFRARVDLRIAYAYSGIRFSIYSQTPKVSAPTATSFEKQSPGGVLRSVQSGMKSKKIQIATEFKKFLIVQREADSTSAISNSVASRVPLLSDNDAFGSKKEEILVTPRSVSRHVSLPDVAVIESIKPESMDSSNGLTIQDNFHRLLRQGIDPASAALDSNIRSRISSNHDKLHGLLYTRDDSRLNQSLSNSSRSIRKNLENYPSYDKVVENRSGFTQRQILENKKSLSEFNSSDLLPVEVNTSSRYQLIDIRFPISKIQIPPSQKFFIKMEVIDDNGIIIQTKNVLVDHRQKIEIFQTPRVSPEINVKNKGDGKYFIEIFCSDQNIGTVKLFAKHLYETSTDYESFVEIGKVPIRKIENKVDPEVSGRMGFTVKGCEGSIYQTTSRDYPTQRAFFEYTSSTTGPVLFRAVGVSRGGKIMSNFSTSRSICSKTNPAHAVILGEILENGIKLSINKIPIGAVSIEILRRNLTKRERVFTPPPILNEVTTTEITTIKDCQTSSTITYLDESVVENGLYEYKVAIIYATGERVVSSTSLVNTFIPPSGISSLRITNLSRSTSRRKKRSSYGSIGSRDIISMNIELMNTETLADVIIAGMTQQQISLFGGSINSVKTQIGISTRIEVTRTDMQTGEIRLETVFPGEFQDDGTKFGNSPPLQSRSYFYRFEPLIVSPDDLLRDLQGSGNINENSNLRDPRNRAAAANASKKESRQYSGPNTSEESGAASNFSGRKNYTQKFYTKSSLLDGTLDYGNSKSKFDTGRTGDFAYATSFSTIPAAPIVSNFKAEIITLNGVNDVILTWKVKNASEIDHFIITSTILGSTMTLGAAHNSPSGNTYRYLARDFRDFSGGIDFSIIPILNDGSSASSKSTGTIQIRRNN